MAKFFFSLRGIPEDEAQEVYDLLTTHDIDFYETPAGNWGISMPAIWLYHESDFTKARSLLDEYQQKRAIEQRAIYLQLKKTGQAPSFWGNIKRYPMQFLVVIAAIALIVYISIKLLFEFGL